MSPMSRWTPAQVEKLAPDAASVKAARGLSRPGPWSDLGATDSLVWGKCQGSGKSPYQVSVDLTGPAFKCSCPSRKFPCKHSLALLMLWAAADGVVADMANSADFASDWAQSRADRNAQKKAKDAAPPDPEAQAKRLAERLAKMDSGIEDFELWLHDLVRQGLASARTQPTDFWERAAGRLVDAQLPGLADRVRRAGTVIGYSDTWLEYLLDEIARWYLAVRGWKRRNTLPDTLSGDLRAFLGWARPSAEVIENGNRLPGPWTVVGVSQDDTGRILAQRTWLSGPNGSHAIMLDFATAGGSFGVAQVVGTVIEGEAIAYPGAEPARVLVESGAAPTAAATSFPNAASVAANLDRVARWTAANPFSGVFPATLASVTPRVTDRDFSLVDEAGVRVVVNPMFRPWDLVIHCADGPTNVFGEWSDGTFNPLAVESSDRLVPL